MLTISDLLRQLPTSTDQGLGPQAVADSVQRFGANRLTPLAREPVWQKFLAKFDEPIIKILLGAALLSMIVDLFQAERMLGVIGLGLIVTAVLGAVCVRRAEWIPSIMFAGALILFVVGLANHHVLVEGMAVMIAVILATGVAFASEFQSEREFEALNAHKDAVQTKVVRGGSFHTLPLEEVVVGDVVLLEMGDEIPADGRLTKATELFVDQSLMTGESEPVRKYVGADDDAAEGPDQPMCLYRGTQVVDGAGQMLVTAVGDATVLGQIARRLAVDEDAPSPPTPLPASGERGEGGQTPLLASVEAGESLQSPLSPLRGEGSGVRGGPARDVKDLDLTGADIPSPPTPLPASGERGEGGQTPLPANREAGESLQSPLSPLRGEGSGVRGGPARDVNDLDLPSADAPSPPTPLPASGERGEGGRIPLPESGEAGESLQSPLSALRGEGPGVRGGRERIRNKLTISKQLTPLQHKLKKLADLISTVGYIAAVLIFLAQLLHGLIAGKVFWTTDPEELLHVFGVLLSYFVNMVIIIVVAVPEGLPMSVTVSLALAMRKMTRANSLVRQLVACETIGSATVICTDKTGTLTQNRMEVMQIVCNGRPMTRPAGPGFDFIALNAAVNSTANLEEKQGAAQVVGNSTEGALLLWLQKGGADYKKLRAEHTPLHQVHFSSERKRMTTVVRRSNGLVVLAKGSPEWMLANSTHYLAADGNAKSWTPEARQAVDQQLQEAAAQAMRSLAFGHAQLAPGMPEDEESLHARRDELESGLVYVGFAAIRDPVRGEVKEALAECQAAGIKVKMVTGDNVETARAIAFDIGLVDRRDAAINAADGKVMTSAHYNSLSDEQLKQCLPQLRVLARARPLDKYRMVKLLQELGEVVAVTGDGTNDAPALKKADVGLAMGITGTEVAKEASKIVLLDDSFATIVKAVHWGRALYENIQRFIQFQLTINVSALTIYLLGTLIFQVEAPFTVLQLLWINVIMDTFASIALCSEPPRPGLMQMPPKKRDDNIVTRAMVRTLLTTAVFFVVVMLGLLVGMKGTPSDPGWFADRDGPWSVEVGGTRLSADRADLDERTDARTGKTHWHIRDNPSAIQLEDVAGREVEIAFTVPQVSIFFSVYVFFQVWNLVNCRSLTSASSGLYRLWRNPTFIAIAGTIAIGQIIIVTFGGAVFKVQPLSPLSWLAIIAATSSVLVFAELSCKLTAFFQRGEP